MFYVLYAFFAVIPFTDAANVLVFWPLPIPSHFHGFEPLFTELATRGHNVTVVSHFPKSKPVANYTDIAIIDQQMLDESLTMPVIPMDIINYNVFQVLRAGWKINKRYAEKVLPAKNLQDFVLSESYSFDLVLIESFYQEYTVTMGHKFGAPVVCITSTLIQPTNSHWIGLPTTFSYLLDVRTRSSDRKTFHERLKSTMIGFIQVYLERFLYVPAQTGYMDKYFRYKNHESRPSIGVMLANVSLTLVNGDVSVGAPRPYLPGVVEIGGLHLPVPKRLPDSLRRYVESAVDGVIFISFGTYVHPCKFPKRSLDAFVSAVGKLKQKVLWRWGCDGETPNVPAKNVIFNKWFPQFDILSHPNVKLFITHGGLHSVEESTYNAVPMVGVPFFADQFTNIKLVEQKGYGRLMDLGDVTQRSLLAVIDEILTDPRYKENAIAFSKIYKDSLLKPMDRAVYWIEYVLRNGGASHLKSHAIHLNSIQAFRLLAAVAALFVPFAAGANILAFVPMPMKSHFGGFRPMFEELARRGHNITVVSSFPSTAGGRIANYTDVDVSPPKFPGRVLFAIIIPGLYPYNTNFLITVVSKWSFANMLSRVMDHPNIKELIRSEANSFDLVMVESFFQEYTVALGHKFNAPVVNLAPAMIWASISKWLHVPATFAYVPDCCVGTTDHMGFVERVKNTVTGVLETYVEDYLYVPKIKEIMNRHFRYGGWESRPALEQMLGDVSLTLMNAHHVVGVCRPYPPGVIEVGGMHIREPKPLPPDLLDYVESASHGVVYFSFGSLVNLSSLPETKLNIFLRVIGELKQKVIMKWSPGKSVKLPANLRIGSWLPQMDILAHPNVKLFVTHGGLNSIEEAVYNAKPVVGIPFFADQLSNLKYVEKNGFGKMLPFSNLTAISFRNAIEDILTDPKFEEMAAVRSRMFRDQPMKPLDRAVYWIEYVVRHGGAKHLKSDSIGLNDAQYFLLDFTAVMASLAAVFSWLCYWSAARISSKCIK
ncbi:UDP-glucuronosyl/UDP-glucosyltransferase [Cinara cedri]|uniref:UDP-glucuronosyl/UDP-glucosyltransferase n=1 Tax=Cinara cedri TaxID=506608 RepID=A0A5E4MPV4_9HEMI|nr:UDP-glucuronosyl/UDP-glucosyltransferase [Cinara cedri]